MEKNNRVGLNRIGSSVKQPSQQTQYKQNSSGIARSRILSGTRHKTNPQNAPLKGGNRHRILSLASRRSASIGHSSGGHSETSLSHSGRQNSALDKASKLQAIISRPISPFLVSRSSSQPASSENNGGCSSRRVLCHKNDGGTSREASHCNYAKSEATVRENVENLENIHPFQTSNDSRLENKSTSCVNISGRRKFSTESAFSRKENMRSSTSTKASAPLDTRARPNCEVRESSSRAKGGTSRPIPSRTRFQSPTCLQRRKTGGSPVIHTTEPEVGFDEHSPASSGSTGMKNFTALMSCTGTQSSVADIGNPERHVSDPASLPSSISKLSTLTRTGNASDDHSARKIDFPCVSELESPQSSNRWLISGITSSTPSRRQAELHEVLAHKRGSISSPSHLGTILSDFVPGPREQDVETILESQRLEGTRAKLPVDARDFREATPVFSKKENNASHPISHESRSLGSRIGPEVERQQVSVTPRSLSSGTPCALDIYSKKRCANIPKLSSGSRTIAERPCSVSFRPVLPSKAAEVKNGHQKCVQKNFYPGHQKQHRSHSHTSPTNLSQQESRSIRVNPTTFCSGKKEIPIPQNSAVSRHVWDRSPVSRIETPIDSIDESSFPWLMKLQRHTPASTSFTRCPESIQQESNSPFHSSAASIGNIHGHWKSSPGRQDHKNVSRALPLSALDWQSKASFGPGGSKNLFELPVSDGLVPRSRSSDSVSPFNDTGRGSAPDTTCGQADPLFFDCLETPNSEHLHLAEIQGMVKSSSLVEEGEKEASPPSSSSDTMELNSEDSSSWSKAYSTQESITSDGEYSERISSKQIAPRIQNPLSFALRSTIDDPEKPFTLPLTNKECFLTPEDSAGCARAAEETLSTSGAARAMPTKPAQKTIENRCSFAETDSASSRLNESSIKTNSSVSRNFDRWPSTSFLPFSKAPNDSDSPIEGRFPCDTPPDSETRLQEKNTVADSLSLSDSPTLRGCPAVTLDAISKPPLLGGDNDQASTIDSGLTKRSGELGVGESLKKSLIMNVSSPSTSRNPNISPKETQYGGLESPDSLSTQNDQLNLEIEEAAVFRKQSELAKIVMDLDKNEAFFRERSCIDGVMCDPGVTSHSPSYMQALPSLLTTGCTSPERKEADRVGVGETDLSFSVATGLASQSHSPRVPALPVFQHDHIRPDPYAVWRQKIHPEYSAAKSDSKVLEELGQKSSTSWPATPTGLEKGTPNFEPSLHASSSISHSGYHPGHSNSLNNLNSLPSVRCSDGALRSPPIVSADASFQAEARNVVGCASPSIQYAFHPAIPREVGNLPPVPRRGSPTYFSRQAPASSTDVQLTHEHALTLMPITAHGKTKDYLLPKTFFGGRSPQKSAVDVPRNSSLIMSRLPIPQRRSSSNPDSFSTSLTERHFAGTRDSVSGISHTAPFKSSGGQERRSVSTSRLESIKSYCDMSFRKQGDTLDQGPLSPKSTNNAELSRKAERRSYYSWLEMMRKEPCRDEPENSSRPTAVSSSGEPTKISRQNLALNGGRTSNGNSESVTVQERGSSTSQSPKLSDFEVSNSPIGKGRTGLVFEARQRKDGKIVALKAMSLSTIHTMGLEDQIENEWSIQMDLRHLNIIQLYGHFRDNSRRFFVLELANGGTLRELLRSNAVQITESQAAAYAYQLTLALNFMHSRNIIHRDLKPENILLQNPSREQLQDLCAKDKSILGVYRHGIVKVADFGFACRTFTKSNKRHTFCGTADYLAPEMVSQAPYDYTVDIWGLGAIIYELLSGQPPFASLTKEELCDKITREPLNFDSPVSADAKRLITRLCSKNADDRPPTEEILCDPWILRHTRMGAVSSFNGGNPAI